MGCYTIKSNYHNANRPPSGFVVREVLNVKISGSVETFNFQSSSVRHASKCEKIVWVSEGQPSGDFELWGAASLRCLQGCATWKQFPWSGTLTAVRQSR